MAVESTDTRSDGDILDRVVPGHQVVTLGAQDYPLLEPSNKRARVIRKAFAEYDRDRQAMEETDPGQMDLMEDFLDRCLKKLTPEIEADWARIEDTGTDTERLAAMAAMRDAVVVPFQQAAAIKQGQALPSNRATRRSKKGANGR